MYRRKFLGSMLTASALLGTGDVSFAQADEGVAIDTSRFKISLNAYSFNALLNARQTDLEALILFCAKQGFDAIDMTGYYFPNYPEAPSPGYVHQLKNKAHRWGVAISGTGVRNDFGDPDRNKRTAEIQLVKRWIEVAATLGAPVIRIFTAKTRVPVYTRQEQEDRIVDDILTCVEHAKQYGVIVAMQNHNDFVKTANDAISILKKVNSDWFGLVLDTGSFVTEEPYGEIAKATPYAVNWQLKQTLSYQGVSSDMDLDKLCRIICRSAYRGYLPIETLNPGNAFEIVPPFLRQVRAALEKAMRDMGA